MMNNDEGSALIWSSLALLLMILLVTAMMGLGAARLTKSKNQVASGQAYYTAKGVVDIIGDAICSQPQTASGKEIIAIIEQNGAGYDSAHGMPKEDWPVVEGLLDSMGSCRIRIQYRDGFIRITAYAMKGKSSCVLTLQLEPKNPEVIDGGQGEEGAKGSNQVTTALGLWKPLRYWEGEQDEHEAE